MYTNNSVVALEFSRRGEHKTSTSRTFVRLIVLDYKRARQSTRQAERIQSALCEENNSDLKIAVVKIDRIFVCVYASRSVRRIANSFVIRITNK